jgi:hypothetical protein
VAQPSHRTAFRIKWLIFAKDLEQCLALKHDLNLLKKIKNNKLHNIASRKESRPILQNYSGLFC